MALFGAKRMELFRTNIFPEARLLSRQGDIYMEGLKGLLILTVNYHLENTNPQLQLSDIIINGNLRIINCMMV